MLGDVFVVGDNVTATDLLKKHKGKDVLNRLAGQLLAAKLNIWALNMTNLVTDNVKVDCIGGNVTEADAILVGQSWEGPDDDKKFDLKSDRRDALKVHKFLDIFNNFGCDGIPPLQGEP